MKFVFKVQIIIFIFGFKEICANIRNVPRVNKMTAITPNLSLYRYEGNFYPASRNDLKLIQTLTQQQHRIPRYINPVRLDHQVYHNVNDGNRVPLHATGNEYQVAMKVQPLQQVTSSSGSYKEKQVLPERNQKLIYTLSKEEEKPTNGHEESQLKLPNRTDTVTRHYHDIYLKLKTPQDLIFGHIINWPELAEKKVEKRDRNNYKGQVIWADPKGGYGEHYWDLAQGAL